MSKLLIGMGVAAFVAAGLMSPAYAVPTLQLDSDGAPFYDVTDQTIVTEDSTFSIFAIGTPNGKNNPAKTTTEFTTKESFLNAYFYLSIAVTPKQENAAEQDPPQAPPDLGSFKISNGTTNDMYIDINGDGDFDVDTNDPLTINVTGDMVWGIPPAALDNPDSLGPHGVFETYYIEIGFQFNASDLIQTYNTQCRFFDTTIDPDCELEAALLSNQMPPEEPEPIPAHPDEEGESLFHMFDLDVSLLDPTIGLHFDLYFYDERIEEFAPYSHDAAYRPPERPPGGCCIPVPEPNTLPVFGFGLLSLAFIVRRRFARV